MTISTEDLNSFENKTVIARAIGRGNNKSLKVVSKVNVNNKIYSVFEVENVFHVVLETEDLKEAIEKYNSI